jgi:ABC-type transporter Mla maintaining outer membrane lipid asymmetry ATPase subunit MlaF
MKTAFHCADDVVFLHEGIVYFNGPVTEMQASRDPVITDFVEGHSGEID